MCLLSNRLLSNSSRLISAGLIRSEHTVNRLYSTKSFSKLSYFRPELHNYTSFFTTSRHLASSSDSDQKGLGLADKILQSRIQSETPQNSKGSPDKESKGESEEEKKKREASWRAMKYTFIAFGVSFGGLALYVFFDWGSPRRDENGKVIEDEFSHVPFFQQYLFRAWREINYYKKMIRDPSREKLLPNPLPEPYIQPPYTLVIELTGVMVHPDWTYKTGWRFKKRPGVDFFLSQVAPPLFEIVIYTAEQGFTAFPIIDALDPNGYISYRLFRDATRYVDGTHVKDLDCLNRDISKVIVVDWNHETVKFHPRNLLKMKKWMGNDDDRELFDLAILLRTIATSEVEDVRTVLDFYSQFDDPIEAFKENQRKLQEQQERRKSEHGSLEKPGPITRSWTPSFLGFGRKS